MESETSFEKPDWAQQQKVDPPQTQSTAQRIPPNELTLQSLTMEQMESALRTHELRIRQLELMVQETHRSGIQSQPSLSDDLIARMTAFLNKWGTAATAPPLPAQDANAGE
jgi:Tfp pilus assembly protein PilX